MTWNDFIENEKKQSYFIDLMKKVDDEYKNNICYPKYEDIFNAFKFTPLDDVKVVILGQDPYHEPNQAHGLSFSVLCEKLPPSLKNIYKEMSTDLNLTINQNGDLTYLAQQGVLLLNTVLTVREHEAFSHKKFGWEIFTDHVINLLNELNRPIVFILWGSNAEKKCKYLNNPKHYIIKSEHPSPLSAYRGFFGSKPFSKCNEYLKNNKINEIKWNK